MPVPLAGDTVSQNAFDVILQEVLPGIALTPTVPNKAASPTDTELLPNPKELPGVTLMAIVCDRDGSAPLTAVRVTFIGAVTPLGAVYVLPVIVPAPFAGTIDQFTVTSGAPETVGVNAMDSPGAAVNGPAGETDRETGNNVRLTNALTLSLLKLMAVIFTTCCAAIGLGGVYTPELDIEPTAGSTV